MLKKIGKIALKVLVVLLILDLVVSGITWGMARHARSKFAADFNVNKEDFIPADLDPNENSYETTQQISEHLRVELRKLTDDSITSYLCSFNFASNDEITEDKFGREIQFFDNCESLMDLIREGATKKYSLSESPNSDNLFEAEGDLLSLRHITNLLLARALLAAYRGEEDKALESLSLVIDYSNQLDHAPYYLINCNIQMAYRANACAKSVRVIDMLGEGCSLEKFKQFGDMDLSANLESSYEFQFMETFHEIDDLSGTFFEEFSKHTSLSTKICRTLIPAIAHVDRMRTYDSVRQKWGWRELPFEKLREAIHTRNARLYEEYENRSYLRKKRDSFFPELWNRIEEYVYLSVFSTRKYSVKVIAKGRMLKIYIASLEYKRKNGKVPTSLDEIADMIEPDVLLDPFSEEGERFNVVSTKEELIIWSLGVDRKADSDGLNP